MIKRWIARKPEQKRHARVRSKISGTPERPRLSVYRSTKHIYAQLIDDVNGVTLASASSMDKAFEGEGGNVDGARKVGEMIIKRAAKRTSRMLYSTEAAICTTAELRNSLRVQEKTD